jgi:hypothetical protein
MESRRGPTTNGGRIRLVVFRVLAAVAGLFFLVALVLAVPAPWVLLQPEDPNAAENRWFLTVAGSVDAIAVVVFFALVQRPRRTLLFVEMSGAAVIAAAIILPFDLLFAAILAVAVVPLVVYPYWRDVRAFPSWWAGVPRPPFILATLAGVALLVTAIIALLREIGGTDPAAQANWWSDYAEHATILAVAGVLAVSRGPGWRILRCTCAGVWLSVSHWPHGEEWSKETPILATANSELRRPLIDGQVNRGGGRRFHRRTRRVVRHVSPGSNNPEHGLGREGNFPSASLQARALHAVRECTLGRVNVRLSPVGFRRPRWPNGSIGGPTGSASAWLGRSSSPAGRARAPSQPGSGIPLKEVTSPIRDGWSQLPGADG